MVPNYKQCSPPILKRSHLELLPGVYVWLIHLGGGGCQCNCSVIDTTPTYVPEHIYPCGPGAHRQRACGYRRKWCSGLSGHCSRALRLSTVISSEMVITCCKNKHHYHLVLRRCTETYTPRNALDHQNTPNGEQ